MQAEVKTKNGKNLKVKALVDSRCTHCYDLKSLESDDRTTLILNNTRELDRELFYKLVYLI